MGCGQSEPIDLFNLRLTFGGAPDFRHLSLSASQPDGKQIERCVISTFQVAESMGFKGDFRQWEHLLRVGG